MKSLAPTVGLLLLPLCLAHAQEEGADVAEPALPAPEASITDPLYPSIDDLAAPLLPEFPSDSQPLPPLPESLPDADPADPADPATAPPTDPAPPVPLPEPGLRTASSDALRVGELLSLRIGAAKSRLEDIAVDLSVFTELEGIEAQLKEARLQAEQAKLETRIAELSAARDHAALAARSLDVFADQTRIQNLFASLNTEAMAAKSEIESYRAARAQEIALLEARQPTQMVDEGALASEASAFIRASIAGWDDSKRASFLALTYAVANELNVRIPQRLADGSVVQNDFVAALHRPEAAELQVALITLAAYQNRLRDSLDGTILGKPFSALNREGALANPRCRTYEISQEAKNAYLLNEVNAIWRSPEVTLGRWDLGKHQATATAIARFDTGAEKPAPDAALIGLRNGVGNIIQDYRRTEAIADALQDSHTEMLGQAKRHDLRLEQAASAVFQAEGLSDRLPQQQAKVAEAAHAFAREAARLASPDSEPDTATIRQQALSLNEAAISVNRAELIARSLRQR
ncbi:hypothetical protein BH23VER1_BH23VER1_23310 [soil metagenome]